MAVRLSLSRAELDPTSEAGLASEFSLRKCLRFRDWLAPCAAARAGELCAKSGFELLETAVGSREIADCKRLNAFLTLLLNRGPLFEFLERVTGKGPIQGFEGRVYRLRPGSAQQLKWHDDKPGQRKLALSISLSGEPYSGGEFQMRSKGRDQLLAREANLRLGEAILFDVDPNLEHRVTAVHPGPSRVAFAGWFLPRPAQAFQSSTAESH